MKEEREPCLGPFVKVGNLSGEVTQTPTQAVLVPSDFVHHISSPPLVVFNTLSHAKGAAAQEKLINGGKQEVY